MYNWTYIFFKISIGIHVGYRPVYIQEMCHNFTPHFRIYTQLLGLSREKTSAENAKILIIL